MEAMTLTEFLLARIAEDEAVATAATPGPWRHNQDGDVLSSEWCVVDTESGANPPDVTDAAHIARHDPARILAECEAKRQIIDEHQIEVGGASQCCVRCGVPGYESIEAPCDTIKYLALPYANHPDYLPEWKP